MQEQLQAISESIRGIVDRVTFHNPDNGWSVLRVTPFQSLDAGLPGTTPSQGG